MRPTFLPAVLLRACLGMSRLAQAAESCGSYAAELAAMAGADQKV